jgi:hypothetical protein
MKPAMSEHPRAHDPSSESVARQSEPPTALASHAAAVPGRLAVLSGLSLLLGAMPLPIVPSRILRQVRGAVAHDALARSGVALVSDARAVLAEPDSTDRVRKLLRKGVEFASRRILRRLGPFAALSAVASAFEVYALGHLLGRYVAHVRPRGTIRMHEAEARRVRRAIDAAALQAFSPGVSPERLTLPDAPEDLRDELTRWLDTLLLTGATLPSYLQRRLDAAFDKVVAESPELHTLEP